MAFAYQIQLVKIICVRAWVGASAPVCTHNANSTHAVRGKFKISHYYTNGVSFKWTRTCWLANTHTHFLSHQAQQANAQMFAFWTANIHVQAIKSFSVFYRSCSLRLCACGAISSISFLLFKSIDTVAKAIPAVISCRKVNFQTNPTYHRKVCTSTFPSATFSAKWLFSSAITNIFPAFKFPKKYSQGKRC